MARSRSARYPASCRGRCRRAGTSSRSRDPSPLVALPRLRIVGLAEARLSPAGAVAVQRLIVRGVEVVR
jgi:hypothetical protein